MTTDQVPPITRQLPDVEPEGEAPRRADTGIHADDSGYRRPVVDVDELRAFLDGQYREVRELVRANLAEHAQILV